MPYKERPVLFSADMVKAILNGNKTQTRRILKPQPDKSVNQPVVGQYFQRPCPYGQVGDRLWVRETYRLYDANRDCACDSEYGCGCSSSNGKPYYKADSPDPSIDGPWKPSIYMPRIYSRISLEITSVKIERLHSISEADASAEGVYGDNPRQAYKDLWNKINGKDAWEENPWVWVINFKRIDKETK